LNLFNSRGLIKESHHDNPDQYKDCIREAAYYYQNVLNHPEDLINLDDKVYLLIHHPWYNYYHWLCESILRLWLVREKKDNLVLLLPDYYKHSDFIQGSLAPFNFTNIYYIPFGKSLHIKNICLPQIKPHVDSYDKAKINQIKDFYLDYISNRSVNSLDLGERIYISRKKAQRKKVSNDNEIEQVLRNYNFKIINNEDYTFIEQIAIYSKAKFLVSIHGSGLTNMLFMSKGSSVLEFHKRKTNEKDWHSKAFWYLADALELRYFQQLCEPTDTGDDYFNANFIVDPETLNCNLHLMCQQY
jgi:capsular polysaccharide biosynthesis protein